ncbi:hypothetical protein C8F04DRAFT_1270225 [Mycena alexandri]|uniref:Uncharacterized protein n=1 Tax=Mycena alexandri TaxID=1745969 RepID=A0AAD6SAZ6_9AGAR|nr:hypothetical protein C8F04DRAFT_1270225 [Mycena alexandri]
MGNRDNSLEVIIDTALLIKRSFKLWNIFPLTTTEFEGRILARDATSLFDAIDAWVVIIGPDSKGNTEHIGPRTPGRFIDVKTYSICRSDPFPRFGLKE